MKIKHKVKMAQNQAAAQAAMKRVKVIDKYELIYIFIKLDTKRIKEKEKQEKDMKAKIEAAKKKQALAKQSKR